MAIGVLMMNLDSFTLSLVAFSLNGLGIGLTLPAINMTVFELNPRNAAAALSFLNFFWGVGAILCKPFVDYSSRGIDITVTTIAIAIPLLVSGAVLYFQPFRHISHESPDQPEEASIPIWTLPLAWAIALFNFIHVGFESGMGGWLTSYTDRLSQSTAIHWFSPTLAYFLFFVVGRGVAPIIFRFLNDNKMLMLGLLLILTGMIVTVTAGSVTLAWTWGRDRRFWDFVDISNEHITFFQDVRRIGCTPSHSAIYLRYARRGNFHLVDRICVKSNRRASIGDVRFGYQRLSADRVASRVGNSCYSSQTCSSLAVQV